MASCKYNPGINSVNPYAVLNVTQQSQSVANNTSTVRWELSIYRPSAIYSSAAKNYSVTVNGTTKSGTTTIGGSGTKSIASGTVTVPHNADGTKSISFSFSLDFEINWNGRWIGTGSASDSMTLTRIPRATTPTLSSTTVAMGDTLTINLPRASSSFTHTLQHDFYVGSWTTFKTGATTSATLAIPLSWASRGSMVNQTSGGGRIRCLTYNGSTLIGEKIVNFTATVPASVVPSVSKITVTEAASLPISVGSFVQGKSKLKVVITAAGDQGSTIKSYSTQISNLKYGGSSFTTDVLSLSGTVAVKTTVTDSRGRTATLTQNVSFVAYSPPTAVLNVFRATSGGTADEEGTYAIADTYIKITSLSSKNANSYKIEYKKESDPDTAWKTVKSGSGYSIDANYNLGNIVDVDYSYNFRITVSDSFSSVIYNTTPVPTGFTIVDYRKTGKGIAFGKVSLLDALEIAFESVIYKAMTFKHTVSLLFENSAGSEIDGMSMSGDDLRVGRGGYVTEKGTTKVYGNRVDIITKNGAYLDGNRIPRMISGTRVLTGLNNVTNANMFSLKKLQSIFGVTPDSGEAIEKQCARFHAVFSNGDGKADAAHVDGATWNNGTLFAVFDRGAISDMRINYTIIYTPDLYES